MSWAGQEGTKEEKNGTGSVKTKMKRNEKGKKSLVGTRHTSGDRRMEVQKERETEN